MDSRDLGLILSSAVASSFAGYLSNETIMQQFCALSGRWLNPLYGLVPPQWNQANTLLPILAEEPKPITEYELFRCLQNCDTQRSVSVFFSYLAQWYFLRESSVIKFHSGRNISHGQIILYHISSLYSPSRKSYFTVFPVPSLNVVDVLLHASWFLPTPSFHNGFHFPSELLWPLVIAKKMQQSRDAASAPPALNLQFFLSLWLLRKLIPLKYTESKIKHLCERKWNEVSEN